MFISFLVFCVLCSCESGRDNKEEIRFKVSGKTLYMNVWNITGSASAIELTSIVRVDDRYYCFFETPNIYPKKKYFFIMRESGIIEKSISIPEEMYDSYGVDLFVQNDSILVKTNYDTNETYYFDRNKLLWEQIREVDDIIYEDEIYYVTTWRSRLWFRDKESGKEYGLKYLVSPIVSRVSKKYYITALDKILEIDDPHNMTPCGPEDYYNIVRQQTWNFGWGEDSFEGARVLYNDSTYFDHDRRTSSIFMMTSFVYKNQLLLLCSDSESTFIAKLDNGQLIPVQRLDQLYPVILEVYEYKRRNQENYSEILLIGDEKDGNISMSGFIEIIGNKINIRHLKQY